jgi:hypothetical protein
MTRSPLQRAIERGLDPSGDLFEELDQLPDYPIRTREDAIAICQALAGFPFALKRSSRAPFVSPVSALVGLFQDIESFESPAFEVLADEGVEQLIRIYDLMLRDAVGQEPNDPLFILKVLVMYAAPEATDRIVEAARTGFRCDDYMWEVILSIHTENHPERAQLLARLRDPLPRGFMAVAFLDAANEAMLAGVMEHHPFDSDQGKRMLHQWLVSGSSDENSYAHSATAALPFVGNPERDQLLALAMDHPASDVQMEAVWAAAKLGSSGGLKTLSRYCLDVQRSVKARQYLTELNHEELIPEEALDPHFQARAEFSDWLTHPNELGCPPDELEVIDHRILTWPLDGEEKPFWIIKYRLRDRTGLGEDDVDCGVVGSVTFCHFSEAMCHRSPEDIYAIHCYWEAEEAEWIRELEPDDPHEYAGMWNQWPGGAVAGAEIVRIADLAPQLNYPQRLVAIAAADLEGEEGWIVLDGPRSRWYPRSEMPADAESDECGALKVHIGRQLLGFSVSTDRQPVLADEDAPARSPQHIVRAYEALLEETRTSDVHRRRELLMTFRSPLGEHFLAYAKAKSGLTGGSELVCLANTYQKLLRMAWTGDDTSIRLALDHFSPVGSNFRYYVHALVSLGEQERLRETISRFSKYWDDYLGFCQLGLAAYYAQEWNLAEHFLSRLLECADDWFRGAEISLLAEIWFHTHRSDEARQLLLDCLVRLHQEISSAARSDRRRLEDSYHAHQETLQRLFPREAEALMRQYGLPAMSARS